MTARSVTIAIISLFLIPAALMADISVDPDAFVSGTTINNAFPGVTLTALGDPGVLPDSNVYAISSSLATTGSNVFGDSEPGLADSWGNGYFDYLRVDFAGGAKSVSLDFIANDSSDGNAELRAFNSSGVVVDSVLVASVPYNSPATLTVSASNIAYVQAEWDRIGRVESGCLDNLRYEPVPAPGAALLGLIGLSLVGWMKRRFSA